MYLCQRVAFNSRLIVSSMRNRTTSIAFIICFCIWLHPGNSKSVFKLNPAPENGQESISGDYSYLEERKPCNECRSTDIRCDETSTNEVELCRCISRTKRKDRIVHCEDKTDEPECHTFCRDKTCFAEESSCDKKPLCADRSDHLNCTTATKSPPTLTSTIKSLSSTQHQTTPLLPESLTKATYGRTSFTSEIETHRTSESTIPNTQSASPSLDITKPTLQPTYLTKTTRSLTDVTKEDVPTKSTSDFKSEQPTSAVNSAKGSPSSQLTANTSIKGISSRPGAITSPASTTMDSETSSAVPITSGHTNRNLNPLASRTKSTTYAVSTKPSIKVQSRSTDVETSQTDEPSTFSTIRTEPGNGQSSTKTSAMGSTGENVVSTKETESSVKSSTPSHTFHAKVSDGATKSSLWTEMKAWTLFITSTTRINSNSTAAPKDLGSVAEGSSSSLSAMEILIISLFFLVVLTAVIIVSVMRFKGKCKSGRLLSSQRLMVNALCLETTTNKCSRLHDVQFESSAGRESHI